MSNCRRLTHDWTELEEGTLSRWRRFGLRVHLVICPMCRAYSKQMKRTVEALLEVDAPLGEDESRALAAQLLARRKK